jgi:hypothetical protein
MIAQHIEQRHIVMRNGNADIAAVDGKSDGLGHR